MKLITSVSVYMISLILVGLGLVFLLIGDGFLAWPQHLGTIIQQLALPKRAPFAVLIVLFVIAVPTIVATWHWRRLQLGKPSSLGSIAGRASAVAFGSYAVFVVGVLAVAQATPPFSVMESVNLKFGIMLLGAWSILVIVLAIPAGNAVNRLLRSKPNTFAASGLAAAKAREHDKPGLGAMTLNERLVHVGLIERWDEAVRRRDRAAMTAVLERVEVADPEFTVAAVLARPHD